MVVTERACPCTFCACAPLLLSIFLGFSVGYWSQNTFLTFHKITAVPSKYFPTFHQGGPRDDRVGSKLFFYRQSRRVPITVFLIVRANDGAITLNEPQISIIDFSFRGEIFFRKCAFAAERGPIEYRNTSLLKNPIKPGEKRPIVRYFVVANPII